MVGMLQFLEIDVKEGTQCDWCKRRKFKENEKFYKVFVGEKHLLTVCEICKYGHAVAFRLGPGRSYESHFVFFLKQKMHEFGDRLPNKIKAELSSALENFLEGKYSENLRNIGFIAEWITKKIFVMEFGEGELKKVKKWEDRLGRLTSKAREEEKTPEETLVHQLASLKWLRNKASHPSEYEIDVEDSMLGLVSIIYCLHCMEFYGLLD